jgi:hypothetical protein
VQKQANFSQFTACDKSVILPPCKALLRKHSAGWKYSVFNVQVCLYDAVPIVRKPYTGGISALETPFIHVKKQEDIFSVLHKHQYIF